MQNEFDGRALDTTCGSFTNSNATTTTTAMPAANGGGAGGDEGFCFSTGSEVLDYYNLDELSIGANIAVLLGLIVAFRLIAYWILRSNGPTYDTSI